MYKTTGNLSLPTNVGLEIDQICCKDNLQQNDMKWIQCVEVQNETTTMRKILFFLWGIKQVKAGR